MSTVGAPLGVKPPRPRGRPTATSQPEIVAGALRVLDKLGLDRLTMRSVADELGVGVATVYNHIPNKERLLELVILEAEQQLPPEYLQDWAEVRDWREIIRLYALAIYREALDHPGMLDLFLMRRWMPENGAPPVALDRAVELAEAEGADLRQVAVTLRTAIRAAVGIAMFERSIRQRPPEDMVAVSAKKLERTHPGAARLITAGYAPERGNEEVLSDLLRALVEADRGRTALSP